MSLRALRRGIHSLIQEVRVLPSPTGPCRDGPASNRLWRSFPNGAQAGRSHADERVGRRDVDGNLPVAETLSRRLWPQHRVSRAGDPLAERIKCGTRP